MNDLDAELLYNRDNFKTTEFHRNSDNALMDKSFKGLDKSLLGFEAEGIIESEVGENDQQHDDLYSTYGRCK